MVVAAHVGVKPLFAPAFRFAFDFDPKVERQTRHTGLGKAEVIRAEKRAVLGERVRLHHQPFQFGQRVNGFAKRRTLRPQRDEIAGAPKDIDFVEVDVGRRFFREE